MKNLNASQWERKLANHQDAVILDVRTPAECAQGTIPGARCLDFYNLEAFTDEIRNWNKQLPYFVYCRSGQRSHQACRLMESLGFEEIHNLDGGMLAWPGGSLRM